MHYRREIDGLRAIAVLAVILFHAGFEGFRGGFVGVDVFFVISGYLITSIILSGKQDGTFTLLRFYERRARRILPALFLVMLACLPFAWLWMLPAEMVSFSRSLVAVLLFASNILFWRETGYFATANELKPLLHTWSLAVEEQYYVLFPLFLLLAWRLGRRWMVGLLALAAVASLALAQWSSINSPTAGFYLLPTRGWELLIGALAAFHHSKGTVSLGDRLTPVFQAGSLLGMLLIGYAICAFDRSTPFPSLYALAPTLGTLCVILFATPATLVGRLLGSKVLVGIGLLSYSAYLWHQPLFAFARMRSIEAPGVLQLLSLAVLSILLAFLSWKFVEQPCRDSRKTSRQAIFGGAIAAALVMVGVGVVGQRQSGFESRFSLPSDIAKTLVVPDRRGVCFDRPEAYLRTDWLCDIGPKIGNASFLVFGDSHALTLLPAFEELAGRNAKRGLSTGASGCIPLLGVFAVPADQRDAACHRLNQRVYEYVKAQEIKKVFLVARWTYYTDGGYDETDFSHIGLSQDSKASKQLSREAFEQGLEETVAAYAAIGVQPIIVSQAPQQRHDARTVYYKAYANDASQPGGNIRKLSVSVAEHLKLQLFTSLLFGKYTQAGRLSLVSLDDLFCDSSKCLIGTDRASWYFDDDHLSVVGAHMAAGRLAARFLD